MSLLEVLHREGLAKSTVLISVSFSLMVTRSFTFNRLSFPSLPKKQDSSPVELEYVFITLVYILLSLKIITVQEFLIEDNDSFKTFLIILYLHA